MIARRAVLVALLASPTLWVRAQTASPAKLVRVGMLSTGTTGVSPGTNRGPAPAQFIDAMRDLGWIEGRNVVYNRLVAEGDATRLPELADALVRWQPALIVTSTNGETLAAMNATRTIPIVFISPNEPVEAGIIKSFARPGGNATGVAAIGPETGAKRMQLLKEALPKVRRVGLLISPSTKRELQLVEQAAGQGVTVIPAVVHPSTGPEDIDAAFALFKEHRAEAVITAQVAVLVNQRKRIVDLANKQRIPVVGHRAEHVEVGALMSYNSSLLDQRRRAAQIADKVLKGAKPADIPVEQPTKFELVVNLKTAKALGITIAQSILLQADRVIE